ncbi:MAG: hypothetical protein B7X09_04630, partial [Acidiphilium sp. 21-66-27]
TAAAPAFDPASMLTSHPASQPYDGVALAEPQPALAPEMAVSTYRAESVDPDRPETWAATPRNAACPCGSGKKYKYCHGKVS